MRCLPSCLTNRCTVRLTAAASRPSTTFPVRASPTWTRASPAAAPDSAFTLANFMRANIYSAFATLALGLEILRKENVAVNTLLGHGGIFKTPGVAQRYLAAAAGAPVTCMETAGEGGSYGMAAIVCTAPTTKRWPRI